jgi:hypothetical protein
MPDRARPGPRIDFFHEQLRWFDYWLKGKETGVLQDPPVALYVQEHTPIEEMRLNTAVQNGQWRAEETFPPQGTTWTPWYLGRAGVLEPVAPVQAHEQDPIRYNPVAGVTNDPVYIRASMGIDQRGEDGSALTYTSIPLEHDVEVTGQPRVVLHVSSSVDIVAFIARFCDEAPDGTVQLVSRRALNATHRASHRQPSPLKPGAVYEITIPLNATAYRFKKGHRMKLYIACAEFPYLWPTPKPAMNAIHRGTLHPSRIELPVVPERGKPLIVFPPSTRETGTPVEVKRNWRVERDNNSVTVTWGYPDSWQVTMTAPDVNRPAEMVLDAVRRVSVPTSQGTIDTEARIRISSDENTFHTDLSVNIVKAGQPHFDRKWQLEYPRGLR